MPGDKYIKIRIDNEEVELPPSYQLPIAISYSLEDRENFQQKHGSKAVSIKVPATLKNDKIANTFHNPGVEDLTTDQIYKSARRGVIEANGIELLNGKVFLKGGKHTDKPIEYEFNFYGDNSDWLLDLKESTLYDFVRDINFIFDKAKIISSWNFDGRDPTLSYVFAPVRYGEPLATFELVDPVTLQVTSIKDDYNMLPEYMRPSLSKYWIIYKAFKSLGYRIKSDFMDTDYFRRQVMPWTWGSFLDSDGTKLDVMNFLAKSSQQASILNSDFTGILDVFADNDSVNGGFDNSDTYTYNTTTKEMTWTYLPAFTFGKLLATFHASVFIDAIATANSDVEVRIQWFKNGAKVNHGDDNGNGTLLLQLNAPTVGSREFLGNVEDWATFEVEANDIITAKIYAHTFDSDAGRARLHLNIDTFEIDYFRIPLGGFINFDNLTGFKKYKFLDYFSGVVDEFNLCFSTDSINKVVYIEPEHSYSLVHDQSVKSGGYFNGKILDWSSKQDLSKESEPELFDDSERELLFKYKDDKNDGLNNVISNRNLNIPAMGKYVLPSRFKVGKREIENRFFSTVMHFDVMQWKDIVANTTPQMICLLPENISNTSRGEAQNTFQPKSAYYKGMVSQGWIFDGQVQLLYPYMFAVNYQDGGENDPILSYCDEQIGPDDSIVVGKGLLRRFYMQRLAIMENGYYYYTWFHLNNNDIGNSRHREHIVCRGQKWEIVDIESYQPLTEDSTKVFLRKWSPIRS